MNRYFSGKIWLLGDNIDTDIVIPTEFLALKTLEDMKRYAFYPLHNGLADNIREGDIIVAGKNFGCGSSREQAVGVLTALKVGCVIAKSFARIFYRNALNNGLLLIESGELPDVCAEGGSLTVDLDGNKIIYNEKAYKIPPIPDELIDIVSCGGLVPYMQKSNASNDNEVN